MTVEKRKYMNINAMTNYELIQQKELKDWKDICCAIKKAGRECF